jgi:hypothetical protein
MKIGTPFLWTVLLLMGTLPSIVAQDVYISLPASSLFNRSEIATVQNVMNTRGNNSWRSWGVDPQVKSNSGDFFTHLQLANTVLPTSVLQWQLASIGGQIAPFRYGDVLPSYKRFSPSYQTWYEPTYSSRYNPGMVAFRFRIPSS